MWDPAKDSSATYTYDTSNFIAVAICYAIYFEWISLKEKVLVEQYKSFWLIEQIDRVFKKMERKRSCVAESFCSLIFCLHTFHEIEFLRFSFQSSVMCDDD